MPLLGGALIAEVQQNSNTTYRVYDWDRRQPDGTHRSLHLNQALDVIDFTQVEPGIATPTPIGEDITGNSSLKRWLLCKNKYFATERLELAPESTFEGYCDGQTLEIWGVIEGAVRINDVSLTGVQFALLPASMGRFQVKSTGESVCLRVYTPDDAAVE
jgi:mannose-6-phosphate isomerase